MREPSVPNIYEVAKRAGVSTATVSRVLSRPDVVAPNTRRKVMRAVELLGYVPNSAAKNLRTLRSGKLLVTVPDISNPFFSFRAAGSRAWAKERAKQPAMATPQVLEWRWDLPRQPLPELSDEI